MRTAAAGPGVRRVAAFAAVAGMQLAFAVAAHAVAHGCPPSASALLVVVPAGGVVLAAIERLLCTRGRAPRLAGGQLSLHILLSVVAACAEPAVASHAHSGASVSALAGPALMLVLHVVAVLAALGLYDRAERSGARTADAASIVLSELAAMFGRSASAGVAVPVAEPVLCPAVARAAPSLRVQLVEGTRGPPVFAV